jgi:hypothetical protein
LKNNKQEVVRNMIKIDKDSILLFEDAFKESCPIIVEEKKIS